VDRDGNVFEKVTWRRTKCLDCGQHRDDRTYTYKK
jgi:nitrate reductase cytochrome c-type subunit